MNGNKIPNSLISKYNYPVARYTSYPPANYFHGNFVEENFYNAISESNSKGISNISIYVHIPFCPQKCFYCGCNTFITNNSTLIEEYVGALEKELDLVSKKVDPTRAISQIHFGGGSPNYLKTEQVAKILSAIKRNFNFNESPEIAIECHPAELTFNSIDELVRMGFNRISLGVQDFNKHILNTVNRSIPSIDIQSLVKHIRTHKGVSVNLDLIYGLPLQNEENFAFTIDSALSIHPDRLTTFSYAHLPQINPNQAVLGKYEIPSGSIKSKLYNYAYTALTSAGYVAIGFDHFALPNDELAIALKTNLLHRNFQGYCTRTTTGQVLAFGSSGISQLYGAYAQNTKDVKEYIELINQNVVPVKRGYKLNFSEIIAREVIQEIMCNMQVNWGKIAQNMGVEDNELAKLLFVDKALIENLIEDMLIIEETNGLLVTDLGRFFIRYIASAFDSLPREGKTFSKNL